VIEFNLDTIITANQNFLSALVSGQASCAFYPNPSRTQHDFSVPPRLSSTTRRWSGVVHAETEHRPWGVSRHVGIVVNLIIQVISGAVGGNVIAGAAKNIDLGTLGNTIAGAIGGGVGGQILGMLLPLLANTASTPDIGSIVGQIAGGGVAGAVLTAIVGAFTNKTA
jgi:hypothetical protein